MARNAHQGMKPNRLLPLLVVTTALLSGCTTYQYRVVQPPVVAQPIRNQLVIVPYDPLEYRLVRRDDRLGVRIFNPTDDRIVLLGSKSYVIDPRGESHPVRGRVIAPHSYVGMSLPPRPITVHGWGPGVAWGWGWGWMPYTPYYDPFFDDFYGPPSYYYEIRTVYDWHWKTGTARLHLTYDRNGQTFDHTFEIIREPEK